MALITIADVQTVRRIDKTFNSERFDTFAQSAQDEFLRVWLGEALYLDLITNPTSAENAKLLDGENYVKNGDTIKFFGLKKYLAFIWLAIFADEGDEFQANIGTVNFNPSNPTHHMPKTKKVTGENYRSKAILYKNNAIDYLNENFANYPLWDGGCKDNRNKGRWIPI